MDYQQQKPKHAPLRQRSQAACPPPVPSSSTTQQQLTTAPLPFQGGDGCAATACSPPVSELLRGRGTLHYKRLQVLRNLRKLASSGRADTRTMEWYNSGGLDLDLEQMTKEHGTGRFWDQNGMPHDLYPYAFPDYLRDNT